MVKRLNRNFVLLQNVLEFGICGDVKLWNKGIMELSDCVILKLWIVTSVRLPERWSPTRRPVFPGWLYSRTRPPSSPCLVSCVFYIFVNSFFRTVMCFYTRQHCVPLRRTLSGIGVSSQLPVYYIIHDGVFVRNF